jgi:hypothetical protein
MFHRRIHNVRDGRVVVVGLDKQRVMCAQELRETRALQ